MQKLNTWNKLGRYRRTEPPAMFLRKYLPILGMRSIHLDEAIKVSLNSNGERKLAEANREIRSLQKKLNSSGQLAIPHNIKLSDLRPSHFITYFRQTLKSIRTLLRLLISEMESADWDLDAAASSIEPWAIASSIKPGISFWKPNHKCFAFESFVCKEMLNGFNRPNFSGLHEDDKNQQLFFDHYLAWKPRSLFASFCRRKYLKIVHPKMEASFFGNLNLRNSINSGEIPETPFFSAFSEMAKRVWLLHCLTLSFDPEISIIPVSKGSGFSEVYMESLSDEAFGAMETDPRVAFTVVPGFRIGKTNLQCQFCLC
ncbi:hypothetical protein CDL12_15263 [Handroanthus impetiginosus]|uniref:GIL1/IRKI C-terminal domain-containing protein n=1 Tax=Handroanthus impetiginosus TaxID=429701 RepID=A0A2G9H3P3_9LAMI|nr:hypothetical protein CDL12_15263 [Handroanthus impetiginosus]